MGTLARTSIIALRILVPWIFRFILWGIELSVLSFIGIRDGFPATVRKMADEMWNRAIQVGGFYQYDRLIYRIALVIATVEIFLGWIILAHITVFLWGLVF